MEGSILSLFEACIIAASSAGIFMSSVYLISLKLRDTSIVDIAWGLGFTVIATVLLGASGDSPVLQLMSVLVYLWGFRLALHIYARKAGKPEDWRYANWRQQWGSTHWWRSFLQVFLLQTLLMLIIATPLLVAAAAPDVAVTSIAWLGLIVWVVGFYFEAVGDLQLSRFIRKKKRTESKKRRKHAKSKEIMTSGLWCYTRHPNYFGEITQWWGLWLIATTLPYWWLAIISPLTITFLLLKVSGITMLEKKYDDNKEYQKYKQRTSALFPLPPRKK